MNRRFDVWSWVRRGRRSRGGRRGRGQSSLNGRADVRRRNRRVSRQRLRHGSFYGRLYVWRRLRRGRCACHKDSRREDGKCYCDADIAGKVTHSPILPAELVRKRTGLMDLVVGVLPWGMTVALTGPGLSISRYTLSRALNLRPERLFVFWIPG